MRRRIKQLKDYISVTSDWISYALIDDITDAFGPLIQSIEYEVDSIDELVLIIKDAEQSDMLRRSVPPAPFQDLRCSQQRWLTRAGSVLAERKSWVFFDSWVTRRMSSRVWLSDVSSWSCDRVGHQLIDQVMSSG